MRINSLLRRNRPYWSQTEARTDNAIGETDWRNGMAQNWRKAWERKLIDSGFGLIMGGGTYEIQISLID